jgi:UbiD family decarboxylase
MNLTSLRDLIDLYRREGEIVEVTAPVDPYLEIAEIHRRVIAAAGPALLFRSPKGSAFPVVTNLFGTMRRIELAFGRRPVDFVRQVARAATELLPPTPAKLWEFRGLVGAGLRVGLRRDSSGPILDAVQSPPDLTQLPVLTLSPDDGGPFVTLPLVYTEHPGPDGHGHNLGMYRMQVFDRQTTGMHWQIGKGGGFHHASAERNNRPLPVTVFLGGPPAMILGAIAPLPENLPELLLSSLLMGERLGRTPDPAGGYPLLSQAEFALAGEVPPMLRRSEGPFGDHYGYYSMAHEFPVFNVRRMYHRRDAIYPATVVAQPRQEDYFIGEYLQELLSPLFPLVMPSVRDIWSYGETGFHSLAAAVVHERYSREALGSAFRILGEGQLALTKFLLITDTPRNLKDFPGTLEHILARADFSTDLFIFDQTAMDTLDYTGSAMNRGSKGVLLGTGPAKRRLPRIFALPEGAGLPAGVTAADAFCDGCLVVSGPAFEDEPGAVARLVSAPAFAGWPLIVVADDVSIARDPQRFLWATFTRFAPGADIHSARTIARRHHLSYEPPIGIDARMKPWYPKEVRPLKSTAEVVDARWKALFPQGMAQNPRPCGPPEDDNARIPLQRSVAPKE